MTPLSEFIAKSGRSHMNACCDEVLQQSNEIKMIVNGRITKVMLMGPIEIHRHPFRCTEQRSVEFQYSSF